MNTCKTEQEYLNQIIEPVRRCCKRYGYLPSVLIAQSCLENGYGIRSYWDNPQIEALMMYNNMVGIKSRLLNASWTDCGLSVWPGESLSKLTPEEYDGDPVTITDSFRKYDSIEQSFADYLCFMTWGSNYGKGGEPKYGQKVLDIKDPETLIKKVKELGYATSRSYPDSVMDIVRKHHLTQYDDLTGVEPTEYYPAAKKEEGKAMKQIYTSLKNALAALGISLIDRIKQNLNMVPYHNANDGRYLAIHYLGVNGENPDLYYSGSTKGYGGHFYVSRTGQCYQAAKVSDEIWHVGRGGYRYIHPDARNTNTIGIECATFTASGRDKDEETWYFTEETQVACAKLAAAIMYHYKIPMSNLLRHGDITTKNCPSPYKRDAGKGTNWTWEQFRAEVQKNLDQLAGGPAPTPAQELVRRGQLESIKLTGHEIKVDGVRGSETTANMVRCLQRAANMDWNAGLKEDGSKGPLTRAAFDGHFIKHGEVSMMVTAAEICAYCRGKDPDGVEYPGNYGDGLAAALNARYLSGAEILKLTD